MAYYQSFNQLMYLIGKEVVVNRGKNGSCIGRLVSVQTDYLAIQTKDKRIVYYRSAVIASLSESRRKSIPAAYSQDIRIVMAHNFAHLLLQFRTRSLQIDHGGPEIQKGVVAGLSGEEVLLVADGKALKVPIEQIRFVASPIS